MRALVCCLFTCLVLLAADRVAPDSAYPPEGVGKWGPAVTQANIQSTICTSGYTAIIRSGKGGGFGAITESIKKQVYARDRKVSDHLPARQSHCCEIDHAFPLELGGANVIENLWAESWDKPYGARQKDHQAENKLRKLVCAGKMTLYEARICISSDWVACGRKIASL